jgi:hypothetical protein
MASAQVIRYLIGGAGILFIGPMMVFCLWPNVLRAWFEAGPEGVAAAAPPVTRDLIAELDRLGFQALGVKVEKTPLRAKIREFAFVADDRRCYASVAVAGLRSRLYYYTPLPTAGLVLSSNGAFPKIASTNVVQRSYPGRGAGPLLEVHYQTLSSLGQRGEVVPTAEARLDATYAYYHTPEVRRLLRRTGSFLFVCFATLGWLMIR